MSFTNFSSMNLWLKDQKSSSETVGDVSQALRASEQALGILRQLPSDYASEYAVVQVMEYNTSGSATDVTEQKGNISVPNSVIAGALSRLADLKEVQDAAFRRLPVVNKRVTYEGEAPVIPATELVLSFTDSNQLQLVQGNHVQFNLYNRHIVDEGTDFYSIWVVGPSNVAAQHPAVTHANGTSSVSYSASAVGSLITGIDTAGELFHLQSPIAIGIDYLFVGVSDKYILAVGYDSDFNVANAHIREFSAGNDRSRDDMKMYASDSSPASTVRLLSVASCFNFQILIGNFNASMTAASATDRVIQQNVHYQDAITLGEVSVDVPIDMKWEEILDITPVSQFIEHVPSLT